MHNDLGVGARMANVNYPNSRLYSGHYFPVLIDFNFIVDSTNGNGLGIRSLKGAYVKNVYMHTSATPATGNPNPAVGLILVKLTDNFNRLLFANVGDASPVSGTPIAVNSTLLTVGQAYIIVSVGTSTAADWVALGVPVGVTPAVGVSFIAIATGAGSGSGSVEVAAATGSGVAKYDLIGDPNLSIDPIGLQYQTSVIGAWFIFRALAATNSSTTTFVATAPANGTVIGIQLYLSNTSLQLGGQ